MSEHKKCPFCGGEPEPHSYISTKNFILCALCRNGTAMYEKMSDAWEVWDRRAHAQTQPPWIELLVQANCPPCDHGSNECYMTEKSRECWVAYLKDKYGWEGL